MRKENPAGPREAPRAASALCEYPVWVAIILAIYCHQTQETWLAYTFVTWSPHLKHLQPVLYLPHATRAPPGDKGQGAGADSSPACPQSPHSQWPCTRAPNKVCLRDNSSRTAPEASCEGWGQWVAHAHLESRLACQGLFNIY